jgi:hypothetical protein
MGCSHASFDSSSGLLATRLDDAPSTVWIWDMRASELRAVLMFHAGVSAITWHPSISETLLLKCEGSAYVELAFVWDPLSGGPKPVSFCGPTPQTNTNRKTQALWLNKDTPPATIFFSDGHEWLLAAVGEADGALAPWAKVGFDQVGTDESPLELIPAAGTSRASYDGNDDSDGDIEDTFHFKRDGGAS